MDMMLISICHWHEEGGRAIHLSAAINAFMENEMAINMTMRQGILFIDTPECKMMFDAAKKRHTRNRLVCPFPLRPRDLSDNISVEEYRKYCDYLATYVHMYH